MNKHTDHTFLYPGAEIVTDTALSFVRFVFTLPRHVARLLAVWQKRSEQRYTLRMMDDHRLNDMGLTRADVRRETDKGFWQE